MRTENHKIANRLLATTLSVVCIMQTQVSFGQEADPKPEIRMIKTDRQPVGALPPSPNPGFDILASRFLVSLSVDLTKMQQSSKSGVYKYVVAQKQMTKEQYHYNLALHRDMSKTNPSVDILVTAIGKDGISLASKYVSDSLTVLEKIQKGISLDINFTKMTAPKEEPAKPKLIRYGLASRKIEEDPRIQNHVAGSETPEMNIFKNEARKEDEYDWAIQEIYDDSTAMNLESDTRLAEKVAPRESVATPGQNPAAPLESKSALSTYIPSPNFSMKLAPVHSGSSGFLTANLVQSEGFYNFSINRPLIGGGELTKRHIFTMPLIRTAKIQKSFNEKGAERTSLLELKARPLDNYAVNLHYWHQKSHYSCDVGYRIRAHKINFESKMSDIFKTSGYAGAESNAQYKVAYNYNF